MVNGLKIMIIGVGTIYHVWCCYNQRYTTSRVITISYLYTTPKSQCRDFQETQETCLYIVMHASHVT